jgi:hypothetical protein
MISERGIHRPPSLPPSPLSRPFVACALAAFLALTACAPTPRAPSPVAAASATTCPPLPPPTTIAVADAQPGELHELFDLEDTPELFAPSPDDAAAAAYRAAVTQKLGVAPEPHALLSRQAAVMASASLPLEAQNGELVRSGRVGRIAPPNCIERALFARHAARFPLLTHPTEFGAFIVRGNGRVKLYFTSLDRVGGKLRGAVTDRVAADVAAGLVLVAHLHNHPFLFDRVPGDRMWTTPATVADVAGGLAPSVTDVQLYGAFTREMKLREAWLTNGFDGAHFSAADIQALGSE